MTAPCALMALYPLKKNCSCKFKPPLKGEAGFVVNEYIFIF